MSQEIDKYSLAIASANELDHILDKSFGSINQMLVAHLGGNALTATSSQELHDVRNHLMLDDIISLFPSIHSKDDQDKNPEIDVRDISHIRWTQGNTVGLSNADYAATHFPYYVIGKSRSKKTTQILLHELDNSESRSNPLGSCLAVEVRNKVAGNLDQHFRSIISRPLDETTLNQVVCSSGSYGVRPGVLLDKAKWPSDRHNFAKSGHLRTPIAREYGRAISDATMAEFQILGHLSLVAKGYGLTNQLVNVLEKYKKLSLVDA